MGSAVGMKNISGKALGRLGKLRERKYISK
jgi:hypothetical protein